MNIQFNENRVSDPIITPFVKNKLANGYSIAKTYTGKIDLLEVCPNCKMTRLYTFIKNNEAIKECPFCK